LLYWYKSTKVALVEEGGEVHDVARVEIGTQFTCFTGTKVALVEEGGEVHDVARVEIGTQFTCFTGTKVQK
jgi:hypothetical protein